MYNQSIGKHFTTDINLVKRKIIMVQLSLFQQEFINTLIDLQINDVDNGYNRYYTIDDVEPSSLKTLVSKTKKVEELCNILNIEDATAVAIEIMGYGDGLNLKFDGKIINSFNNQLKHNNINEYDFHLYLNEDDCINLEYN